MPMPRVTHTFALLELSPNAYREIAELLRAAGYYHVFDHDGVIDMHGIGVMCQPVPIVHPPTQETSMIKPTVGRVVWLRRPEIQEQSSQPEAALVTFVHSDTRINVIGFSHNGDPFSRTSVLLLQDGDEPREHIYAEWMPYQKAVASGQRQPTLHANDQKNETPAEGNALETAAAARAQGPSGY